MPFDGNKPVSISHYALCRSGVNPSPPANQFLIQPRLFYANSTIFDLFDDFDLFWSGPNLHEGYEWELSQSLRAWSRLIPDGVNFGPTPVFGPSTDTRVRS